MITLVKRPDNRGWKAYPGLKITENQKDKNGFSEKNMRERFQIFTKKSKIPAKWRIRKAVFDRKYGISDKKLQILHESGGVDKRNKTDKM